MWDRDGDGITDPVPTDPEDWGATGGCIGCVVWLVGLAIVGWLVVVVVAG